MTCSRGTHLKTLVSLLPFWMLLETKEKYSSIH